MARPEPIWVGRPAIERAGARVRVSAPISLGAGTAGKRLFFSIDEAYGSALVDDRLDAFVVALLPYALRCGADIVCEAPISRRLLYQLRHYLVPTLAANLDGHHAIAIEAEPTDVALGPGRAVATGWTGGVDSLYTLMRTIDAREPGQRLTHLMIVSNGALESADDDALLEALAVKARRGIAAELGLEVVTLSSNIQELVDETFLSVAAYRQAAVILAAQRLFKTYYSSAAYEFGRFSFDPDNCFYSEFFIFGNLTTDATALYSAYGAYSRAQKLRELSEFPLAWHQLHPCTDPLPSTNCGHCGKCVRTMVALFGLGTLGRFDAVFDVGEFERNLDWYVAQVIANRRSQHYGEALAILRARGYEPSRAALRMARTLEAASKVARARRDELLARLSEAEP